MTSVGFYKINGNAQAQLSLACQLAAKAFNQNMTVLINTENQAQSHKLDELMWHFNASSFLPHQIETLPVSTISICHDDQPGEHHGLLINLTREIPGWLARFERAVEIVYEDQSIIKNKRQNYEYYKTRGYPLKFHDLSSAN